MTVLTSKHAIMIPHAGAILAIRGARPAKSADVPSVRMMLDMTATVDRPLGAVSDMTMA